MPARRSLGEGWFDVRRSMFIFFEPGLTPLAIDFRPFGAVRSMFDVGRSTFDVHFFEPGLTPLAIDFRPFGAVRSMFDVGR